MEHDFTLEYFKEHRDFVYDEVIKYLTKVKSKNANVLEIGPSESLQLKKLIPECNYFCSDIISRTDIDFQMDLTLPDQILTTVKFDIVICAEVMEHVVDPFAAVQTISNLLKPGGAIIATTPLNLRIHGPVPDCWRFTEFGLRVLFRNFEIVEINKLNTPGRPLFPLHYSLLAIKPLIATKLNPQDLTFVKVEP
jgi:SAM-dependent methyltransferase